MQPHYLRLKKLLIQEIQKNFTPGSRFYSQNELMRMHTLSYATVSRALTELKREGYIYRIQGKGTFVSEIVHPSTQNSNETNIGILFSDIHFLRNPFILKVLQGIEKEAKKEHLHFFLYPLQGRTISGNIHATLASSIQKKRIDGFVIMDFITRTDVEFIQEHNIPMIFAGNFYEGVNAPAVMADDAFLGEHLALSLIPEHKRIGMILGPLLQAQKLGVITSSTLLLQGYRKALQSNGIPYDPELIQTSTYQPEEAELLTKKVLSLPDPPTAIIVIDDLMAEKAEKTACGKACIINTHLFSFSEALFGATIIKTLSMLIEKEEILQHRIVLPYTLHATSRQGGERPNRSHHRIRNAKILSTT